MKKVVVTGGAGFIGSHLAEELARDSDRVIILDNLATGKMANIEGLLSRKNIVFIQESITNFPLLLELFQNAQYVFHQAAISNVPRSIENPGASHEANITGTLNVLLAARDNGIKKVIYASSCAVYGDSPTLPQREDMVPLPLSPYAVTKLAGEYYCRVFHQVYGLPTVCLRYFNVYGPRQDQNSQYAGVIPRFIKGCGEGSPPVIFGDGEQTRDFTFVKDVVNANIWAAQSDVCGVFNVSRGESITINSLAELISNLTGSKVAPVHQEPRPGDIRYSLADIAKARAFGYEPKFGLEAGLAETLRWFNGR